MRIPRKLAAAAALAAALLLGTGSALADPPITPPVTSIVAVASSELQNLCNQFSADYNATNPASPLYCWNATNPTTGLPGDTIKTKNDPNCVMTRPNGSSADIAALQKNVKTTNGVDYCIDLGFVSRNIKSSDGTGIASVLFAKDLITWAANAGGNSVANLTDVELTAIYECNASLINSSFSGAVTWKEVGGTSTDKIEPVLPEQSSNTRAQWLVDIGVTTPGSCVINGSYNGTAIAPDEGNNAVFTAAGNPAGYKDVMVPYDGSIYVCQVYAKTCPDVHGTLVLKDIDGKAPLTTSNTINASGVGAFPAAYLKGEYAVVRNAGTATAPKVPTTPIDLTKLLGQGNSSGWICGTIAARDIKDFGFATVSNCGALTGQ